MKKIVYIIITIIALYSCVDPYATDSSYIKDVSALPAASYMERTDSLNLTMWVELLKYTDLYNTMNLAANYTLFVPNNTAMQAYLAQKGVSKISDLSLQDAKTLVKYHTIKGAAYSAVSFEEGMISDTTATGDYLSSSFAEDGGAVVINTKATIIKTIKTNNAYVHILNTALTPVTETIWEKLQSNDFSIFRQAVEATGYNTKLNTITETLNNIVYKYHYTLFAVPDSVYRAKNINSFATLIDSLKAGNDYTVSTNKLNLYVGYHLFNQQISYSSLANFTQTDTKRSKNYSTVATDQLLNISEVSKVLYIDYNSTTKTGVKFLDVNRNCKNGVVHVVDNVMPVNVPKATTLKWELTDFAELAGVSSKYRVSGLSTSYEYFIPNTVSCYKWLAVPDTKPGLSYYIASKNDATQYKATNYDYLKLNLGMYGSVEMTTPTIIAGTYKVTVEHYNPAQAAAIGKVGKIMFIVDGNYFGATVATQGASTTASSFLSTSVGTITFNTSTKHTVKILAIDTYVSYLDCLTFTP